MPKVTARIKLKNKHFEIQVDLDEALKVKAGKGDIMAAVEVPKIFADLRKGQAAPQSDLTECFGTSDAYEVAKIIITKGEVQKTQEFRDAEKEARIKQIVHLLIRNAVDQFGRPYTEPRLIKAIEECHYSFDNRPAEQQMHLVLEKLKTVIPIKLETKRIKLTIPAQYSGAVYSIIKDYKESEDWLANGSLQAILNIPAGMQLDFYDKLNNITHGAVQSEELPQKS